MSPKKRKMITAVIAFILIAVMVLSTLSSALFAL